MELNPFTDIDISPLAVYPKMTQHQIDGCLCVIQHYYETVTPRTDTNLYNTVANYTPIKIPPSFYSKSDFHQKLVAVYLVWTEAVRRQHQLNRRANFLRDKIAIPEDISPQDFWIACTCARKCFLAHKNIFDRIKAIFPLPQYVLTKIYGDDGNRRNVWIRRWRRSGEDIHDDTKMMVLPQEMEDWFYEIASKDMIVQWDKARDFDVVEFVQATLKKTYTLNFKLWFKSLFNLDIEDEQRVKDLIDGATKEMVHTLTNTKLKAIRVYMKAQKLQGGVRFRHKRRVEAENKFKKIKQEMNQVTGSK
tara:strand:- start:293 stop:1207 length:915 start_codon:yes stop_codon:yes gene_type:complete